MTRGMWGELLATGWIGENPSGGEDAFLMLYPAGTGLVEPAPAMADLVREVGMAPGRMTPRPPLLDAVLTGDHVTVRHAAAPLVERPVSVEWSRTARAAGRIVLVLAPVTFTGSDIDAYTAAHFDTCALGLLPLAV